jgi:hypothetical protein
VEEEEEEQEDEKKEHEVAGWLVTPRLGHVWGALRHRGVKSLKDLALDVKDEDAGQLALRSTTEVRRFHRAIRDLRTPMSALRISTEQGGDNKVFKAAEDTIPPDKAKLHLDSRTEVTETNINARSDHGGGEAAHMQLLKEQANKTSPIENSWSQSNCPCHVAFPHFNMPTLTCPFQRPIFFSSISCSGSPLPLPLPSPTAN